MPAGGRALPEDSHGAGGRGLTGRTIHLYEPGPGFPSFSVTGAGCACDCAHCGGRYLEHMVDVSEPDELVARAEELRVRGGTGFLLSGGCAPGGSVDLSRHLDAIRRVKERTGLLINAHTGLMGPAEARALCASGVDVVSVDVVGSRETVREVYGFDAGPGDYRRTLEALGEAGCSGRDAPGRAGPWRIVPHICLGLSGGVSSGENSALDIIREWGGAHALVVISFIPTGGTRMARRPPVEGEALANFIARAKDALGIPVVLGCMRPKRGDRHEEVLALEAGADGIVLPSRRTVEHIKGMGCDIVEHPGCCALIPGGH